MTRRTIPHLRSIPPSRVRSSPGVIAGNLVFVSGQEGNDSTNGPPPDVAAQTRIAMERISRIASDLEWGFADVLKTTSFLCDIGDFPVVDEVCSEFFGEGLPARSTVGVSALPRPELQGEVEAIAIR